MIKVGSFVVPGTSPWTVTGLGFKPRWMIFLFSNRSSEDSWAANPSMGMGWAAMRNSVTDDSGVAASIRSMNVAEIWTPAQTVGSTFVGNITMLVRASGGSDGWAGAVEAFVDDGFRLHLSEGFSSGAAGKIMYYLAGDEIYEQVGADAPFVAASPPYSLGWLPEAFFGVAHGGGIGPPGGLQNFGLADMSVLGAMAGYWNEDVPIDHDMWSVWRGILDPNVNVQDWFGYDHSGVVLEPTQSGGVWFSDGYTVTRTDTTFDIGIIPDAFGSGAARVGSFVLGNVAAITGSFLPSTTVGVPTQVDLPFTPEAVVFFSPQYNRSGAISAVVKGATGWGFCTEDDQALIVYGGHWNPPDPFQSNGMISSSKCWVGNCVENDVGTTVLTGSARVTPGGFEHTTEENTGTEVYEVLYWAVAPKEDIPGFFRVVHR